MYVPTYICKYKTINDEFNNLLLETAWGGYNNNKITISSVWEEIMSCKIFPRRTNLIFFFGTSVLHKRGALSRKVFSIDQWAASFQHSAANRIPRIWKVFSIDQWAACYPHRAANRIPRICWREAEQFPPLPSEHLKHRY